MLSYYFPPRRGILVNPHFPHKLRKPILLGNFQDKTQCFCITDIGHTVADVADPGVLVYYRQITVKDVLYDFGEPGDGGGVLLIYNYKLERDGGFMRDFFVFLPQNLKLGDVYYGDCNLR